MLSGAKASLLPGPAAGLLSGAQAGLLPGPAADLLSGARDYKHGAAATRADTRACSAAHS